MFIIPSFILRALFHSWHLLRTSSWAQCPQFFGFLEFSLRLPSLQTINTYSKPPHLIVLAATYTDSFFKKVFSPYFSELLTSIAYWTFLFRCSVGILLSTQAHLHDLICKTSLSTIGEDAIPFLLNPGSHPHSPLSLTDQVSWPPSLVSYSSTLLQASPGLITSSLAAAVTSFLASLGAAFPQQIHLRCCNQDVCFKARPLFLWSYFAFKNCGKIHII